ncbi:MAG: thioredoxin family protein [Saprospiraceae bacterium]|jgi:thiol:disulfide interchange protein|nr:thioredoxin family protein [Candidatus Opimibacter skivensis]MBL0008102.1 thioredoxin family protein [Candidatus Opimibacter skivensis]HQW01863.1 thioredoxin family protein [Saprospiraceae bacterium]
MIPSSKSFLAGVTLCAFLCCSPKPYTKVMVRPASCSQDVQFADCASLGHLLEFADLMKKPVFLYFYAPWIESCKRMDQYVYTQDELASYFNNHFINYKVNAGDTSPDAALADRYGVTSFPTLLFVDSKGKIMKRHEGPATAAQVLEMGYYLHDAVEKEMVSLGSH